MMSEGCDWLINMQVAASFASLTSQKENGSLWSGW